ncbi:MAG: hypothetical protein IKX22_09080 [Prevotella sp.]|nr:hypothetical protein [Prevotella sp.]
MDNNNVPNTQTNSMEELCKQALEKAKVSRGQTPDMRFDAGKRLANEAKAFLAQIQAAVGADAPQYRQVAEGFAEEILQCGIDYVNGTDDTSAAEKAMPLVEYARSIAQTRFTEERCDDNISVIRQMQVERPPVTLREVDGQLRQCLIDATAQPDEVEYAKQTLDEALPLLAKIKEATAEDDTYYLSMSTKVVDSVLGTIVDDVNERMLHTDTKEGLARIKHTIMVSMGLFRQLDVMAMLPEYKAGRYSENRNRLASVFNQIMNNTDEGGKIRFRWEYHLLGWAIVIAIFLIIKFACK